MLRTFLSVSVVLVLAGCASVPHPQLHVMAPKAPIVKQAPIVQPAPTKPNFSERFKHFRGKLKWIH